MKEQKGKLYADVKVNLIIGNNATITNILKGLEWLHKQTTPNDIAILSGHGRNGPTGTYYYLPVDADTKSLIDTAVPSTTITNMITTLNGRKILFIDTCRAGNSLHGTTAVAADIKPIINELLAAGSRAVVFASSDEKQESKEHYDWKNGAFTKAVVEGIRGKADTTNTRKFTINMLDTHISETVRDLTKGNQTPITYKHGVPDYSIAIFDVIR